MKRLILLCIGMFWLMLGVKAQPATHVDWQRDLDSLACWLPRLHYNFFTVRSREDFEKGIENWKHQGNNGLSDLQMALKLQQWIATFGDLHTNLNFVPLLDRNRLLPLGLKWMDDGLYIVTAPVGKEDMLGCRLMELNGTPIEVVADSLGTLFSADNEAVRKSMVPNYLCFVQLLEHFGFVPDGKVMFKLASADGNMQLHELTPGSVNPQNLVSFRPEGVALCYRNARTLFSVHYEAADSLLYIQYNKCWSRELEEEYGNREQASRLPSFAALEDSVFATLRHRPVSRLVWDVRFNGGGNSIPGTRLAEKLADFMHQQDVPPRVYVVLGTATFSSAILNALDFKRLLGACWVGEETSGKPNHLGEVRSFTLPTSGLQVQYSTKYFKNVDEEMNTLVPDVKIPMTFDDFRQGIDPVYEWIKKQ